jgi:hypothetical protein
MLVSDLEIASRTDDTVPFGTTNAR